MDSGNLNSRISETLEAGSYTIEATTYTANTAGSFTLTISGLNGSGGQPGTDACSSEITGDGSVSGTWAAGCVSEAASPDPNDASGARGYARYYSFNLGQESQVTIALESSVDPYLYLRSGNARSGSALHENDDVESGNLNSRISETLEAGSYTIEATTYEANTAGSFTLRVSGLSGSAAAGSAGASSLQTSESYGVEEGVPFAPQAKGPGAAASPKPGSGQAGQGGQGGQGNAVAGPAVPRGALAFSASPVRSGSTVTLTGTGFVGHVPLQSVRIGGMEALVGPQVFTDPQGNFSVTLTVPRVGQETKVSKATGGGQPVGSPVIVTVVAIVGGEKATGYLVVDPNAGVNSAMPAGLAMSELGSKLQVVWHYDRETKAWRFYDPLLPEFSNLGEMVAGEVYLVQVATTTTVTLNHKSRTLTCYRGNCWNAIVW